MRARSCLCCMRTLPAAPQWAPTHVALADAYSSAPKTTSGPDGETAKILCRVVATAERVFGKNLATVLGIKWPASYDPQPARFCLLTA